MARLGSIVRFLNSEFRIRKIPDSSRNGLQISTSKEVRKIGFAVDASVAVFGKAVRQGCDLVVVHHGLFWRGKRDNSGVTAKRVAFLRRSRMGLYACHLPMDMHPEYGNNIVLARMLGLTRIERFGRYHGITIGYKGRFKRPVRLRRVASVLKRGIRNGCIVLPYGKKSIRSVGIVSGRGSSLFAGAVKERLECFVTGEMPHESVVEARDLDVSVVLGGHYSTETVGVRALMPLIREKFGVKTVFIDAPTSI